MPFEVVFLPKNTRQHSVLALRYRIDLLTHLILQNLMKGYIARDRGVVVLSKGGAFPGTGV